MASRDLVQAVASRFKGDQAKAQRAIESSKEVLEAILDLCSRRIEGVDFGPSDYTNPAWAFQQAHMNGKKEILKQLTTLLSDKPDKA